MKAGFPLHNSRGFLGVSARPGPLHGGGREWCGFTLLELLGVVAIIGVVLKIAAVSPGLRLGGTVLGAALTATGLFLLALGTPK